MSKTKLENQGKLLLSDLNKQSFHKTSITAVCNINLPYVNIDLSEIISLTDDYEKFLEYIEENNLSIFLPNRNYFTVFHHLVSGGRFKILKKLREYVELKEKKGVKFEINEALIKTFKQNILTEEYDYEHDATMETYSNLMESAAPYRSYDKETTEDIEYMSKKLNEIGNKVLSEIFK